jgi:hypothetical protein
MRYEDYERWINRVAAAASAAARSEFALETIRRLQDSTADLVKKELDSSEQQLLAKSLGEIEAVSPTETVSLLRSLDESMSRDEARAVGFHPNILWLLSALSDWAHYRRSLDPRFIARIGIQMVNRIDYDHPVNIRNMLDTPHMATEFERQRLLLR